MSVEFFFGMVNCSRRAALTGTAPTKAPVGAGFLSGNFP